MREILNQIIGEYMELGIRGIFWPYAPQEEKIDKNLFAAAIYLTIPDSEKAHGTWEERKAVLTQIDELLNRYFLSSDDEIYVTHVDYGVVKNRNDFSRFYLENFFLLNTQLIRNEQERTDLLYSTLLYPFIGQLKMDGLIEEKKETDEEGESDNRDKRGFLIEIIRKINTRFPGQNKPLKDLENSQVQIYDQYGIRFSFCDVGEADRRRELGYYILKFAQ